MRPEIFILLSLLSVTPRAARDIPSEKVWTNPDLEALRATSHISIIGRVATAEMKEAAGGSEPDTEEKYARPYTRRIENLREMIGEADTEIQSIQDIRETGKGITGAIPLDTRSVGITPEATVEILEAEKGALEAEIDGLQDQARENDISAEAWR